MTTVSMISVPHASERVQKLLTTIDMMPEADKVALLEALGFGRIDFNKEIATDLLAKSLKDQRAMNKNQVRFYNQQMKDNEWEQGSVIQVAVLPSGEKILVNGYHRLSAVALGDITQNFTVIYHPCASMEEVKALYTSIDIGMGRNTRALLKTLVGADTEDSLITLAQRSLLVTATSFLVDGFRSNSARTSDKLTFAHKAQLTDDWAKPGAKYFEAVDKCDEKWLKGRLKAGVIVAVAILTYEASPLQAKAFWTAVAANDSAKASPVGRLTNFLRENLNDALGTNVQARVVALCWNAFIGGKKLDPLDISALTADHSPLTIAETRFDGKGYPHLTPQGEWTVDAIPAPPAPRPAPAPAAPRGRKKAAEAEAAQVIGDALTTAADVEIAALEETMTAEEREEAEIMAALKAEEEALAKEAAARAEGDPDFDDEPLPASQIDFSMDEDPLNGAFASLEAEYAV